MAQKRNLAGLVAGLLFISFGVVFLAVNVWGFHLPSTTVLKLFIPSLLILAGLRKLIRHFTWKEEELLNRPGKASLLSGVFWSSLGLVFLLDVLGVVETFGFFGNYWPLVLIAYGFGKIIDYYRLKVASHIRVGEVFGVIFIAVFGWSLGRISEAHLPLLPNLGWGELPWVISLDSPLPKHKFETREELDILDIESVEIRNLYGDVEIESAPTGGAEVELVTVIRDDSETVAQEIALEVTISKERSDDALILSTNRKELGRKGKKLNTHLTVRLPEELSIRVVNSYGDIRVKQRRGNCQLDNSYGKIVVDEIRADLSINSRYQKIQIKDVEGNVTVTNRRAAVIVSDVTGNVEVSTDHDLVRAENISGNVLVRNQFGRISLEEISGSVHVEGKGSQVTIEEVTDEVFVNSSRKAVTIRNVHKALNLDTSNSRVDLSEVGGPVELRVAYSRVSASKLEEGIKVQGRGSEIALTSVKGELGIETSLRSVSVDGFSGPLNIQNEFGEVSVKGLRDPAAPVRINNKDGGISISIPASFDCDLSAQSVSGEIVSDFGPAPQKSEGRVSLLETKVGAGGPQIELQTTNARIRIRKRG